MELFLDHFCNRQDSSGLVSCFSSGLEPLRQRLDRGAVVEVLVPLPRCDQDALLLLLDVRHLSSSVGMPAGVRAQAIVAELPRMSAGGASASRGLTRSRSTSGCRPA